MGSYNVEFKSPAREEFWQVPFPHRRLFNRRIEGLKRDPRPECARKVADVELYRLILGGWVMLYEVDDLALLVTVFGFRRERGARA